jgi:hypothetical protein
VVITTEDGKRTVTFDDQDDLLFQQLADAVDALWDLGPDVECDWYFGQADES